MPPAAGVSAVAVVFFLASAYLCVVGAVMLAWPGMLSMVLGAPLLGGLELAGPYMFLLVGSVGALVGWGLLRLNKWARRAAIIAALIGLVMLLPTVSAAALGFRLGPLVWGGLGVIVRVMIVWYLYQQPVAERFQARTTTRATD